LTFEKVWIYTKRLVSVSSFIRRHTNGNCEIVRKVLNGRNRLFLQSTRDIKPMTEIIIVSKLKQMSAFTPQLVDLTLFKVNDISTRSLPSAYLSITSILDAIAEYNGAREENVEPFDLEPLAESLPRSETRISVDEPLSLEVQMSVDEPLSQEAHLSAVDEASGTSDRVTAAQQATELMGYIVYEELMTSAYEKLVKLADEAIANGKTSLGLSDFEVLLNLTTQHMDASDLEKEELTTADNVKVHFRRINKDL